MTPIVYGMPVPEVIEAAERGEIRIGGCVIRDGQPLFVCRRCRRTVGWLDVNDPRFEDDMWDDGRDSAYSSMCGSRSWADTADCSAVL